MKTITVKLLLVLYLVCSNVINAQIVDIPDENFKNALLNHEPIIDVNGDGEIQVSEAVGVTSIDVSNSNIDSLIGIEAFTDLTDLICFGNYLTNLDISDNINLTSLNCNTNNINELDLSSNINLTTLHCQFNELEELDLSANLAIVDLNCADNNLSNLDIGVNTSLEILNCKGNDLDTLDVSTNSALTELNCKLNNLNSLDLSSNVNLTNLNCSRNNLDDLDLSANLGLIKLFCSNNNLSDLNINEHVELRELNCWANDLGELDLNTNTNLTRLTFGLNNLNEVDLSHNINLEFLYSFESSIENLDLSSNTSLLVLQLVFSNISNLDISANILISELRISQNQDIHSLDLSSNSNLQHLRFESLANLNYINLKNGNNHNFDFTSVSPITIADLPNLETVCVDETDTELTDFISEEVGHPITFTTECGLLGSSQNNQIVGQVNMDIINTNDCSSGLGLPHLLVQSSDGNNSYSTFTKNDGSYILQTGEGEFTTTMSSNLPDYFDVNPTSYENEFVGFGNSFEADFCVTPNRAVNDVNIMIIPINEARPGFNAFYEIVYENVGSTILNGDISLTFDDTMLTFLGATLEPVSQTNNSLNFVYENLNPFEKRTIDLAFNIFPPPTVNIDDVLDFMAVINPVDGDHTQEDNTFELNQTVVGSFDPNDIRCLEGDKIRIQDIGKYLHYIIRFQNTGTASAINVKVNNVLDEKLDWSTFQIQENSHPMRTVIRNGNEIEFIFDDIHLPDSTHDEPNSHGYIVYKIKPKSSLEIGDIILNKAAIYFDFNEPIITNTAETEIVEILAVDLNTLILFSLYPIPADDILRVESNTQIRSIEIYSKLGQYIMSRENSESIDISGLDQGVYICKVENIYGNFDYKKLIKK